jgi:hypothetical protein
MNAKSCSERGAFTEEYSRSFAGWISSKQAKERTNELGAIAEEIGDEELKMMAAARVVWGGVCLAEQACQVPSISSEHELYPYALLLEMRGKEYIGKEEAVRGYVQIEKELENVTGVVARHVRSLAVLRRIEIIENNHDSVLFHDAKNELKRVSCDLPGKDDVLSLDIWAKSKIHLGRMFVLEQRFQEAVSAYGEVLAKTAIKDWNDLDGIVCVAAYEEAGVLGKFLEKEEEAMRVLMALFETMEFSPNWSPIVLSAYLYLLELRARKGEETDVATAVVEIVDGVVSSDNAENKVILSKYLAHKLPVLFSVLCWEKKIDAIDRVLMSLKSLAGDEGRKLRIAALTLKARLMEEDGRYEEAKRVFEVLQLETTVGTKQADQRRLKWLSEVGAVVHCINETFSNDLRSYCVDDMANRMSRWRDFLANRRSFSEGVFLFVLREWNSFTPLVPGDEDAGVGGGYFLWVRNRGFVVDPGLNFVENFCRAGGRVNDIDCVVMTHAHCDHTGDFEGILTLLHEFNEQNGLKKKIDVVMSMGVERKFSGILPLRDFPVVEKVYLMAPSDGYSVQRLRLAPSVELTVLPANHDDVVTKDGAVGCLFEIELEENERRTLLFTGDTGLFPIKRGEDGKKEVYSDEEHTVKVRWEEEELAVFNNYPAQVLAGEGGGVDLVVCHMGSVKPYELDPLNLDAEQPVFYPNHLGLRGVVLLLKKVVCHDVVVSEFGEEMKDIKFRVVEKISSIVKHGGTVEGLVVPGDPFTVYDVGSRRFFCHSSLCFEDARYLCVRPDILPSPATRWDYDRFTRRAYLFRKGFDGPVVRTLFVFEEKLRKRELCYMKV